MANSKLSGMTQETNLTGAHSMYAPTSTPADRRILAGDVNLLPDGWMWDGKLSVTVSSNNITVALKTRAGNNPSATEPVTVHIGGTRRRCTAALSVTKAAGTNWFNSGATPTATLEVDYFVYIGWNTTPATDIVDIGFARVPFGRLYSDFSTTTTSDRYLAYGNASQPAATDEWVCVGRFAATLSGGAGYTWSVPTFTNANLIQHPISTTRRLTWVPSPTGYSSAPANGIYEYTIRDNFCTCFLREPTNGTSNSTAMTMTTPIAGSTTSPYDGYGFGFDNNAALTTTCRADISAGGSTITWYPNGSASATWTASLGKRIANGYVKFGI